MLHSNETGSDLVYRQGDHIIATQGKHGYVVLCSYPITYVLMQHQLRNHPKYTVVRCDSLTDREWVLANSVTEYKISIL